MDAECIRSEVRVRFSRSSGPGGQHAQKSSTRVEALFDVAASAGLRESERRRVIAALGPVVRSVAQDERSQLRNRELATERVLELVAKAARPTRPRRPTLPSLLARERRLEEKRRLAERKRLRRPPED
jgi:ribosome-associated protein